MVSFIKRFKENVSFVLVIFGGILQLITDVSMTSLLGKHFQTFTQSCSMLTR